MVSLNKNVYTIGEASKIVGLTPRAIRLYEKKGLIKPTSYSEGNYRLFTIEDLANLQQIKLFKKLDLSLEEIQNLITTYKSGCTGEILEGFKIHRDMLSRKINKLLSIKEVLDQIISTQQCNSDDDQDKVLQWITKIVEVMDMNTEERLQWTDKWDFDRQSKNYDRMIQSQVGEIDVHENYNELLNTVLEKATSKSQMKVLDIGTGTGNLGGLFIDGGHSVVGIDQSEDMLKKAKEKYPLMEVIRGNFLALPCHDQEFDCVVSTYALHHLVEEDKKLAIKEMMRVLKINGRIVIGDLMFLNNQKREEKKQELLSTGNVKGWEEIEDEYYGNVENMEAFFKSLGMKMDYKRISEYGYVVWAELCREKQW